MSENRMFPLFLSCVNQKQNSSFFLNFLCATCSLTGSQFRKYANKDSNKYNHFSDDSETQVGFSNSNWNL